MEAHARAGVGRFFVFSPPRSGTSLLSAVLSAPDRVCFHDLSVCVPFRLWPEFLDAQEPAFKYLGVADTGNVLRSKQILSTWPRASGFVVERPRGEVEESLWEIGEDPLRYPLAETYAALDRLPADMERIPFAVLRTPEGLQRAWRVVFGEEVPRIYLSAMLRLQVAPRYIWSTTPSPAPGGHFYLGAHEVPSLAPSGPPPGQ